MLFHCKYKAHGETGEQIFDVLDQGDLYSHCYMFGLEVLEYTQITFTEDNSDKFVHEKGGVYVIVDKAVPAGDEAREFGLIIVYQDVVSGRLYYRHWKDFVAKLSPIKEE